MTANRTALVTGASRGIGRAVALALLREGWQVVLGGRDEAALDEVAGSAVERAISFPFDVTDAVAVGRLVDRLPAKFAALDLLVNNAGHDIGGRTRFDQGPVDDWLSVIETNVAGLIRVTRAVVPGMIARGHGDIVNIGSVSALRIVPDMAAYSASKAAVHAFSDGLRADLAEAPIRVIEVMPGLTRTAIVERRFRGDRARAEEYFARFGAALEPEDVAASVLFAVRQPPHVTVAQLLVIPSSRY